MGLKITLVDVELGNKKIKIKEELKNKYTKEKIDKIISKTGFKTLHKETSRSYYDMALTVSQRLIKKINTTPDILIFITQDPNNNIPSKAEKLANDLNFKSNIFVSTLSMSCSSFPYAIFLINSLFNSSNYKSALIVSSELYTNHIDIRDLSTKLLFSDGASATYIKKIKKQNLLSYDFGHEGKNFNKIILNKNTNKEKKLYMKGSDVYLFTISQIPKSINKIKQKGKIKKFDIIFLHQASKVVVDGIHEKIGIKENVPNYFDVTGNLVSSSIPLLIKKVMEKGLIKKNMKVCISGFGVGLSWGTIALEWQ